MLDSVLVIMNKLVLRRKASKVTEHVHNCLLSYFVLGKGRIPFLFVDRSRGHVVMF